MFSVASQLETLLQQVRTDPSKIQLLLNDKFSERSQQIELSTPLTQISEQSILEHYDSYFRLCKMFLFGQVNVEYAVDELKKSQSVNSKGVCAKTLKSGNIAWKCETCELDPTCIICQECFEKGNHKGHKVWIKRNVSGCCDCGDPDAWREDGFCSDHRGYAASSEALLELLPQYIKQSSQQVFRSVCRELKIQCMNLQDLDLKNKVVKDPIQVAHYFKTILLIRQLFAFLEWSVEISTAFIHFITDALNLTYFDSLKPLQSHQCCFRSFITQEEQNDYFQQVKQYTEDSALMEETQSNEEFIINQQQFASQNFTEENLQLLQEAKKICTCNVIDLTLQTNQYVSESTRKNIYEFYFKLFQSFRFKQILGLSFAANFEVITVNRNEENSQIGSIGVQILTIDEIGYKIVSITQLRETILSTLSIVIDNLIASNFDQSKRLPLIFTLYDLKYLTRPKTLQYLINETDFLESMLQQLIKLYFTDIIEFQEQHVMFDRGQYKEGLYAIDIQLTKIYKNYLRQIDPNDIPRNRKLMSAFVAFFQEINEKMHEEKILIGGKTKGFFAIPLHRVFGYYFTRVVMHNYFKEREINPHKDAKDIFQGIFRQLIEIPPQQSQNSSAYIQNVIDQIMRPLARSWCFTHEILSGKWVMSGLFITQLPRILYSVFDTYLLLNLTLFQMLIIVAPHPHNILDSFLILNEQDNWMKLLHSQLIKKKIKSQDYEEFKPIFDEKKLRQMLHWELRWFITVAISEVPFIYPLLTDLSTKNPLPFRNQQINNKIESLIKNDLKREIVHNLIQFAGRAEIKDLKKVSQDIYLESEYFEDALLQVADQVKDSSVNKKVSFKIKEQYLEWFDPYYKIEPESQAKILEGVSNIKSDALNNVIGNSQSFKYGSDVNKVITEALSQSTLIIYIKEIINFWLQTEGGMKIIDEQVGHECLKLLSLFIQGAKSSKQFKKEYIIDLVSDNNFQLIETLFKLMQEGGSMEKSCGDILTELHGLTNLQIIGDRLGLSQNQETEESQQIFYTQNEISESDKKQKQEQIKEQARLKKEAIMAKFSNTRQNYIKKNVTSTNSELSLSRQSSQYRDSSFNTDEDHSIECSLCKETLETDSFYSEPYGQFAYISRTKLMYHTLKQTLKMQNESLSKIGQGQQQEEEKKGYEEVKHDEKSLFNDLGEINYLNKEGGTGGTIIKCNHYSHFKCLNNYQTANESDLRKSNFRKLIGLDFQTFQCPLCKHISNGLLPCDSLRSYDIKKFDQKDFDYYHLIEPFASFLSKVLKSQELKKSDTLPVDIRNTPLEVLKGVQRFVEHRIQIIDIKGMNDFLRKSIHQVGRKEYADIIDLTINSMRLIVDGGIKLHQNQNQDEEMTVESFNEVCINQIRDIIEQRIGQSKEVDSKWHKKFYDQDFSSLAIQLIFYATCLWGNNYQLLEQKIQTISQMVYKAFKAQVLLKLAFIKNNGQLKDTNRNIFDKLKIYNILQLSSDQDSQELIVRTQLPFLRKLTSLVLVIRNIWRREYEEMHQKDEIFIHELSKISDDADEFTKLIEFLKLDRNFYELNVYEEQYIEDTQNEEHYNMFDDLVAKFSSTQLLVERLEAYVLHKLQPDNNYELSKDQLFEQEYQVNLKMPNIFKLQDTYFTFKLLSLPPDFQGLVQEYYKKLCKNCGKQPKESAVCLLCGENLCFLQKCCYDLPGMRKGEGDLTFHTRTCEGNSCIFMNTATGKMIMIEDDRSSQRNSPYLNKFGETFSSSSKKWDNFYLDDKSGGIFIYEEFRKIYMNFNVSNEVIKDRSINDYVWRMRIA